VVVAGGAQATCGLPVAGGGDVDQVGLAPRLTAAAWRASRSIPTMSKPLSGEGERQGKPGVTRGALSRIPTLPPDPLDADADASGVRARGTIGDGGCHSAEGGRDSIGWAR
jgi:hypothetical protein